MVCEKKAPPKDVGEDGDVVFLSIEKSDRGISTTTTHEGKTMPSDAASQPTPLPSDSPDLNLLTSDSSDVNLLTSDSSDVSPLTSDSSDVNLLTSDSSDVSLLTADSQDVAAHSSNVTPLATDSLDGTPPSTDSLDGTPLATDSLNGTSLNKDILCTAPVDTNSLNVATSLVAFTNVQHVSSKQVKVEVFGDSCASSSQRTSSWAVLGSQTVGTVVPDALSQTAQPLLKQSVDSADYTGVTGHSSGPQTVPPQSSPIQSCPQSYITDSANLATCFSTPPSSSSAVVSLVSSPATAADGALDKPNHMFTNWLLPGTDSDGRLSVADRGTNPVKSSVKSSFTRSLSSSCPSSNLAHHSSVVSPRLSVELPGCASSLTTRLISDQRNVPLRKRLRSDGELVKPWCKLQAPEVTVPAGWSTRCSVCGEEERKVSRCMQGHQTCCICLEERAKYLLSDKKGVSRKHTSEL